MKIKKYFSLFFVSCISIICVFSLPLEELAPSQAAALRASDSLITEAQLRNPSFKLLPNNSETRILVNSVFSNLNPSILVEALYLYNKPAHSSGNWTAAQRSAIFNQLTALSTMAGIEYYSASRDTMRTFFELSSVIDGPSSKNPIADPVHPQPPASLTLHARQKDLTFGDYVYRYNYTAAQDFILFSQENITSLSYGIIPVIGKGNLRSVTAVYDCGDSLLVYTVFMAKALSVPGMGDRIGNSFSNRAEAVINWFSGRASEVF